MAHSVYKTRDGKKVPSVTTVLGRFKDAGPLMYWAHQQGLEGKDFREVRDAAASSGTMAHAAMEAWKHGKTYEWPADGEIVERAKRSFGAFLEWTEQTRLRIDKTEMPLVSEKYAFGGTFDAILIGAKRALGDYKTSSGVYGEYLAQLAGYGLLWEENFPEEPLLGGYHLLRFDKNHGDFSTRWWQELEAGKRFFLNLRAAYADDKELRERAK